MYAESTDIKVEMSVKETRLVLSALTFAVNHSDCSEADRADMREMVYELAEAVDADVIEDEDEDECECECEECEGVDDAETMADILEQVADELRTKHGL